MVLPQCVRASSGADFVPVDRAKRIIPSRGSPHDRKKRQEWGRDASLRCGAWTAAFCSRPSVAVLEKKR